MSEILPILSILFGIGASIFAMVYMFRALRDATSPRHALAREYCVKLWRLKIETSRRVISESGDIVLTCFRDRDTVEVVLPRMNEIQQVTGEKPILDSFEGRAQLTFVNTPNGKRKEAPTKTITAPASLRPTTG